MNASGGTTLFVTRTVKPGFEARFEAALHDFVQRSLRMPGQMGVHIVRPPDGSDSREYGIIRKFATDEALASFQQSAEFLSWTRLAAEMTEGPPRYESTTGLESWFTPQHLPLRSAPRWKLAVATYLGVFPTATLLSLTLAPAIQSWPFLLGSAAFNACVVLLLTWAVMPLVTRILHRWLFGTASRSKP